MSSYGQMTNPFAPKWGYVFESLFGFDLNTLTPQQYDYYVRKFESERRKSEDTEDRVEDYQRR